MYISDQLIRRLLTDFNEISKWTIYEASMGRCKDPLPQARATLGEVLFLAAQEEEKEEETT
jgi:hypothetical protein